MGDVMEECRTYGYGAGIENAIFGESDSALDNGHRWLTEDTHN